MSITIKTESEIELMRISCRLLSEVHYELGLYVKPGISTADINDYGEKLIRQKGGIPNFLHYAGYPASICVSVNEEVVHGIPTKDRILKEGDIVSLDAGLIYKGYHSDAARTYGVGEISSEAQQLIDITRESFFAGIKKAYAGNRLHDISAAIDDFVTPYGYGIVEDLCGHGIGTHLHEDPMIPNFRQRRRGPKLKKGMTLAIEPMINMGTEEVEWLDDDWTVVTCDGAYSAHYENTILITDSEPEILTLHEEERKILQGGDICQSQM
ncbi:MAG: type I methionyl aminopeptidase [Lachnospiraceae bacterium]|nr:type I methionyl aminopeptidase [Lachnospiraceae bacterium]